MVGITGPRQSGKTTLAKSLFPHLPCVSLENLDIRMQAQQDPRGFLLLYQNGAIFDEIQHGPELLSYLQQIIDESNQKGRFVVTGSQHFVINQHIAQSLAGRVGMVTLLPLSLDEINKPFVIIEAIFNGGYPGLHNINMHPTDFYPSCIQTYVERDVRQLKQIDNISKFQIFLRLCARRTGQLLNLSSLAQDCGISQPTARSWLTILEASYLVFLLQPYYQNFNKRVIKMPKLYFYDAGLACTLLELETSVQLETHYLKGALFENIIILEFLKRRFNHGLLSNIYFWRDHAGHEINLLLDHPTELQAIEIKSSATYVSDFIKGINYFKSLHDNAKGYVIYLGQQEGTIQSTQLVPVNKINDTFSVK
ncbi:MAG TPA: ATP-binding protein, partial [Patescibacteria group bacterium]|nr:ATP-binding protein [Patescibacteria group bacterium]